MDEPARSRGEAARLAWRAVREARARRDAHVASCEECWEGSRMPEPWWCDAGEALRVAAMAQSDAATKALDAWAAEDADLDDDKAWRKWYAQSYGYEPEGRCACSGGSVACEHFYRCTEEVAGRHTSLHYCNGCLLNMQAESVNF